MTTLYKRLGFHSTTVDAASLIRVGGFRANWAGVVYLTGDKEKALEYGRMKGLGSLIEATVNGRLYRMDTEQALDLRFDPRIVEIARLYNINLNQARNKFLSRFGYSGIEATHNQALSPQYIVWDISSISVK